MAAVDDVCSPFLRIDRDLSEGREGDDPASAHRSPEYVVATGPDRNLEGTFLRENNCTDHILSRKASHDHLRMFVSRWIETDRPSGLLITRIARNDQLAI